VSDDALRRTLESFWAEVRTALAEYDVPRMKRLLQAPEGMPTPTRPQAADFLKQLPDLSASRFLQLVQERDRAGYVARTHLDKGGTTLTIIRFRRAGGGWELVPAPETLSSFEVDAPLDAAGIADELATQPVLKLFPPDEMLGSAPPAPEEPPDERPEPVIRKELEGIWRRIREAFAAGTPERVAGLLLYEDGGVPPGPEAAREAATAMPDLTRARFDKLVWSLLKPQLVGYCAQLQTGPGKPPTVALVVFVRKDGAYRFIPGPAAVTVVEFPPVPPAELNDLIDTDPRLEL
jgi:hypothetical protein